VNVTLSASEGTVGANQQTVTDERGMYQFLRLVSGTYRVRAELQGFRPAEQQNIFVNADATSRADLKLLVGSLEEGVTVTGESPLLDTTSALRQTVLSREIIEALLNRVDVWSMTRVIRQSSSTRSTSAARRRSSGRATVAAATTRAATSSMASRCRASTATEPGPPST
jgi:hypothetical protein